MNSVSRNVLSICFFALIVSGCGGSSSPLIPESDTGPMTDSPLDTPLSDDLNDDDTISGDTFIPPVSPNTFDSGLEPSAVLLTHDFDRFGGRSVSSLDANTGTSDRVLINEPDDDVIDGGFSFRRIDAIGNEVLISGRDNSVNFFDLDTGEFTRFAPIGSFGFGTDVGSPTCIDENCYARGAQGTLIAFEGVSKEILWFGDISPEVEQKWWLEGTDPILHNGKLYVLLHREQLAFTDAYPPTIIVIDARTGEVERRVQINNDIKPAHYRIRQTFEVELVIAGDLLLVNGSDLVAYDLATMQVAWNANLYGSSVPVFANNTIVASTILLDSTLEDRTYLVGISPQTGQVIWDQPLGHVEERITHPVADDTTVYTKQLNCNTASCIYSPVAFDAATGQLVWVNTGIHSNAFRTPLLAGNALFFGDIETMTNSDVQSGIGMISKFDGSLQWINSRVNSDEVALVKSGDSVYRHNFTPSY